MSQWDSCGMVPTRAETAKAFSFPVIFRLLKSQADGLWECRPECWPEKLSETACSQESPDLREPTTKSLGLKLQGQQDQISLTFGGIGSWSPWLCIRFLREQPEPQSFRKLGGRASTVQVFALIVHPKCHRIFVASLRRPRACKCCLRCPQKWSNEIHSRGTNDVRLQVTKLSGSSANRHHTDTPLGFQIGGKLYNTQNGSQLRTVTNEPVTSKS